MPRPSGPESRLETSVYRTHSLSEAEVWEICRRWYEEIANLLAKGRGDGPAKSIVDAGLSFDADGRPHPKHANIVGWHSDPVLTPPELKKNHWMIAARRFAGSFKFVPHPREQGTVESSPAPK